MRKMDKLSLDERRRKTSRDVSYYNRFLWQRYTLAFLFFFNLNLAIFTLGTSPFFVVPLVLLVLTALGLFENVKLYANPSNQVKKTKVAFKAQLVLASLMLVSIPSEGIFKFMFPFLNYQKDALILIFIVATLMIVVGLLNLSTINKIARNEDNYFKKVVTVMDKYSK